MNILKKVGILALISVLIISTNVVLFNFISNQFGFYQDSRAMCGTTVNVFFNDTSQFDQKKIIGILRENLKSLPFNDVVGSRPWWDYLTITQPDENKVSSLFVPSVHQKLYPTLNESFEKIHGFSKIEFAYAYCE